MTHMYNRLQLDNLMKNNLHIILLTCGAALLSNVSIAASVGIAGISPVTPSSTDTIAILQEGIESTAAKTLKRKKQCKKDAHCKTVSVSLCGNQHVLYSTFGNNAANIALNAMAKAKKTTQLKGGVAACTHFFNPPPKLECNSNSQCVETTDWSVRVFPD